MNWKWPKRPGNRMEPWYVIARRLLFIGPIYLFAVLYTAAVLGGWGPDAAEDAWEDLGL